MKYRNIGIDIDCTLTELMEPTIRIMAAYYGKPVPKMEDIQDYNLSTVFGITEEESLEFWKNCERELVEKAVLSINRYISILKNFVSRGSKVYIITNRSVDLYKETYNWLVDNGVHFDELVLTSGQSKVPAIKRLGVDVMIDDNPTVFREVAESGLDTVMVCVDYGYNQDVVCDFRMDLMGEVRSNVKTTA